MCVIGAQTSSSLKPPVTEVMLDIMLTAGAVLVAVIAWAATGGFSEDEG